MRFCHQSPKELLAGRWIEAACFILTFGMSLVVVSPAFGLAQTDVVTREVTVWNNPNLSALGSTDTISREVTLWNNPNVSAIGATDSISRELTVWNDPRVSSLGQTDTLSREITVQAGTVVLPNDVLALKVAGGLIAAGASQMPTLNVVSTGISAGRVDILDAVRLVRKAAGLDP